MVIRAFFWTSPGMVNNGEPSSNGNAHPESMAGVRTHEVALGAVGAKAVGAGFGLPLAGLGVGSRPGAA